MLGVEFVKVSGVVDEDGALQWLFGEGIVADTVMSEIVEDFESEEVARCADVGIPREYGFVDDFHVRGVAPCRGIPRELRGLQGCEGGRYLNDFEFRSSIHIWVNVADVVQYVQHQRSIPCTKLIYYKVV